MSDLYMSYKILESNEMHFKTCTKCGETLPATTEYFYKHKSCKYGLSGKCKKCIAEQQKQYYEANKEKVAEQHKQYYENNKEKVAEQSKRYREENKEKIAEYHKQYNESHKEEKSKYDKQYRKNNIEKILEYHKKYYEENKEKVAEKNKQYRENNKEKVAEQHKQYYENNKEYHSKWMKQWYENNKEKVAEQQKQYYEANKERIAERYNQYHQTPQGQANSLNRTVRRRARMKNQGNGITKDQWLEMMNFFNWKCAYSSEVLSEKGQRSIDHIKPLVKGGEHEVWNTVPMYRPYNSSKRDKDMEEWYQEQDFYSEERLQKIYEWQEYAFNKYFLELEKVK